MSEKETYQSISFPELQKALQEAYTKLASTQETTSVSPEEFEACISTLNKLWQAPKASPKDLTSSALSSLAQESIKDKLDWIDERFSVAAENFENETELGLTLLQSRQMLREQVWPLCAMSPCHKRLLTFLINALDRARPKSITKSQLNVLRENIALLATTEITIETRRRKMPCSQSNEQEQPLLFLESLFPSVKAVHDATARREGDFARSPSLYSQKRAQAHCRNYGGSTLYYLCRGNREFAQVSLFLPTAFVFTLFP